MKKVPHELDETIRRLVANDLQPKATVVYAKIGFAMIIGGSISMMICGQFGMSFTNFGNSLSTSIHEAWSHLACAGFCGTIFALLPTIILRITCSPLQYRTIVRKNILPPILYLAALGSVLSFVSTMAKGDLAYFAIWFTCAVVTFKVIGHLVDNLGSKLFAPDL